MNAVPNLMAGEIKSDVNKDLADIPDDREFVKVITAGVKGARALRHQGLAASMPIGGAVVDRLLKLAVMGAASTELAKVLKSIEWSGSTDDGEGTLVPCCAYCEGFEDEGHEKACPVGAALANIKEAG